MNSPRKIAIVGFAETEATSLSTFFRFAVRTDPGYEVVALPQQADIIIADGANTPMLHQLRALRLRSQVLLIGASDEYPNLAYEARPVRLPGVLRAVEYLLGVYDDKAPAARAGNDAAQSTQPMALPMDKSEAQEAPPVWEATRPMVAAAPAPATAAASAAYAATEPASLDDMDADNGFAATQPMGSDDLAMPSAPRKRPAAAQPWAAGGIADAELQAFRAARADAVGAAEPQQAAPAAAQAPAGAGDQAFESTNSFLGIGAPAAAPAAAPTGDSILLVDDSDIDARRIERMLTQRGYAVVRARNGQDALELAGAQDFAFVLVDTSLEGGGYGHCRSLRQRQRARGAPSGKVVAMGRVGGAFERLRARLAGCEASFVQPVDLEALGELIDQLEPYAAPHRERRKA